MRLRKQALGTRNLVGARVEMARKSQGMKQKELLAQLQVNGVDMNASGLSKLEGQIRYVTDYELSALANILNVSVDWLLGKRKIKMKTTSVPRKESSWRAVPPVEGNGRMSRAVPNYGTFRSRGALFASICTS